MAFTPGVGMGWSKYWFASRPLEIDGDPMRPAHAVDGKGVQNACPRTIGPVTICPKPPTLCADAEPANKVGEAKEMKADKQKNKRIPRLPMNQD